MALAQAHFVRLENQPSKSPSVQVSSLSGTTVQATAFAPTALPIVATVGGKEKVFASIEAKFRALAEAWRWHNRGRSILDYDDFAYTQIIGMGPDVVPLLLKDVEDGIGFWYFALKCITSTEGDEKPEMHGDPAAVRTAWIEWGRRNGQLAISRQALANEDVHQERSPEDEGQGD